LQFVASFGTAVLFANKFSLTSIKKDTQDNQYQMPVCYKKAYTKHNNSFSQVAIGTATVYTSQRTPMPNYEHSHSSIMYVKWKKKTHFLE